MDLEDDEEDGDEAVAVEEAVRVRRVGHHHVREQRDERACHATLRSGQVTVAVRSSHMA